MKTKNRYRGFSSDFGNWRPQLMVQITPLCWGLGFGISWSKACFKVGPVAVALYFGLRKDFRHHWSWINDPDF